MISQEFYHSLLEKKMEFFDGTAVRFTLKVRERVCHTLSYNLNETDRVLGNAIKRKIL